MDKAYEMFQKRLREKQNAINSIIKEFDSLIISDDRNAKTNKANELFTITNILIEMCGDDSPQWLKELNSVVHNYITGYNDTIHRIKFRNTINDLKNNIALHDWSLGGYNGNLNFEEIYNTYKRDSKIPELFDQLVTLIEKIISENIIDNSILEKKFKLLLSIVRSNFNRSSFSDRSIVSYLLFFLKEFLLNISSAIPGLREAIAALIATGIKLYEEMNTVVQKTEEKIKDVAELNSFDIYKIDGTTDSLNELYMKKIDLLG